MLKNGDYYFQFETIFTIFGCKIYNSIRDVRCYNSTTGWKVVDIKSGKIRFFGIWGRENAMEAQLNKLGFSTK